VEESDALIIEQAEKLEVIGQKMLQNAANIGSCEGQL
jgi:hypothetical protein